VNSKGVVEEKRCGAQIIGLHENIVNSITVSEVRFDGEKSIPEWGGSVLTD
jgi:hypothetical protein